MKFVARDAPNADVLGMNAHVFFWVQVGSHRCKPFERPPKAVYKLTLHACKGFLMVFASLPEESPYLNVIGWLYDLATVAWRCLPEPPGRKMHEMDDLVCKVRWNVHL